MTGLRINRALAQAGVASRRRAETLVRAGRVKLNGKVVRNLAVRVDPAHDQLSLDGWPLKLAPFVYFLYHKPRGVICTHHDERGRPCVGDICRQLPGVPRAVGRLDRPSEGLMLLTNDGEVALRLSHPRYGVTKEYQVTVAPPLKQRDAARLVKGLTLNDGPGRFDELVLLAVDQNRSRLQVVISEGRQRFIRRMFEHMEYEVKRLRRVRLGPLRLGQLKPGDVRAMGLATEVRALRQALGLS